MFHKGQSNQEHQVPQRSSNRKHLESPLELGTKENHWYFGGKYNQWKRWSRYWMSNSMSVQEKWDGSLWKRGVWD